MRWGAIHLSLWLAWALIWLWLGRHQILNAPKEKGIFLWVRITGIGILLFFFSQIKAPETEVYPLQIMSALAITGAGLGLALWSRLTLGPSWSAFVDPQHQALLIQHGPYSLLRHPIYVGLLMALLGTTLHFNQLVIWIPTILICALYIIKMKSEEKKLLLQFREEYRAYMKKTGF